jgi:Tol biopolymer transport system component
METGKWHKVASGKEPAWSPDGKHLLLTGSPDKLGNSRELYLVSRQGGPLKKLELGLPKGKTISSPTWSPDGKKIVFVAQSVEVEVQLIKNILNK